MTIDRIAALFSTTALLMVLVLAYLFYTPKTEEVVKVEESMPIEAVSTTTAASTTTALETASSEPFRASLEEVMTSGKDYSCHYKAPPEEGDITAVIYVSEGRARGTLIGNIFNNPGTLVSFLLTKEHSYMWYGADTFPDQHGASLLIEATSTKDRAEFKYDLMKNLIELYGCVPWEFEEGFFELPKDIEFVDHTGARVGH